MASSIAGSISDLARKAVNRVETVAGDDAREAVRRAKAVARSYRDDYRYMTGNYNKKKTSRSQNSGRKSSGRP